MAELTRAPLLAELRERDFGLSAAARGPRPPRRIGVEVEMIPIQAGTGGTVPLEDADSVSLVGFLRDYGVAQGWVEERGKGGAPRFRIADHGIIGFEPGGQLEFSTAPFPTATSLLAALRAVVPPLREAAAEQGIELICAGIDPVRSIDRAPLQVCGDRYLRMTNYLQRIGPAGVIMMRQSASIQINLDLEDEPLLRWRVLNAAAPYLVAIFANSAVYAGQPTGHRSFRAHVWRTLDSARTGIFRGGEDAVSEYLDCALDAPWVLKGPEPGEGGEYLPFRRWMERGEASHEDWRSHLTTMFPEICPRGYLEVRSIDALPPEWFAAPVALLAGLTYHRPSLLAAADLLGTPDPDLLVRAGRDGLGEPRIATIASDLFEIALRGCAALGPTFIDPPGLARAYEFLELHTRRGRCPADDSVLLRASA